jgi:ABC-2 type transport system permease protein
MKAAVMLFLRTLIARAYPRIVGLWREPTWVVQETVLPVLSVAAFAFVYRAMLTGQVPEEEVQTYVGFVVLGGAMTAFWLNVLWAMGAQLYWDRDGGNLELFIMAPGSMMAILAGMAVGGMAMTLVRAVVIVTAGCLLFGVVFAPTSWWLLAAVFLLTLVALYGLGMVFASAFLLWGRPAWHLVNLLQEPVYLVSGLNFPIKAILGRLFALTTPFNVLGYVVFAGAALVPLATGIDALRQILFGERAVKFLELWQETLLLGVLSVVFLIAARFSLHHLERLARIDGRLGMKWQ